ncbi:hypothetical protein N9R79_05145 [Vibrio sp.]|nr:hypothetical protein [Vibrio sp.]
MAEQHFVDGIKNVAVIGGNVRVDFYTYTIDPDGDVQEPPKENNVRLVMSPDAFLKCWQSHTQLLEELKSRGLVTHKNGPEGAAPATGQDTSSTEQKESAPSPSFA